MSRVEWDDVVGIIQQRRSMNAPLLQQMLEVQRRYNGDIAIPLPELDTSPILPALTPSLMALTIDSYATRAASVLPRIECPPLEPMKGTGKGSQEFARIRQKTLYATWYHNRWPLSMRRAYRHISGYATAVLVVYPDYVRGFPCIEVRDPLSSYPSPKAAEDLSPVENCGFLFDRSATYLRDNYPQARSENGGPVGMPGTDTEMWELVEWMDDEHTMIGIIGPSEPDFVSAQDSRKWGTKPSIMLRDWPNDIGRCPVVTCPRVTLDRIFSQVAVQIGNIDLQAKLMALAIAAEERAVFPDRYVVASQNGAPRIISNGGAWADGRTGETNIVENVTQIGQLDSSPPGSINQAIDRLERNFAVSSGTNPTFGGETYGALRTGRGIESLLGAQVDPQVQEMQQIMEYGMSHVNELVLDTWKACFGKPRVLFSGWGGVTDTFTLDPAKHIERNDNVVSYAIGGADIQGVTIQLGQLLGTGLMSMRSVRNRHPWVEDAEAEERQLDDEKLKDAMMQSILQQTATGAMDPMVLTYVDKYRKTGDDIFAAVRKAHEELQRLQASQAPAPGSDQPPAVVGAPEAQPGIAGGPQASAMQPPDETGIAAGIGPPGSVQNVRAMLDALNARPPRGSVPA